MTGARFVASGAGIGLLPRAPGTWGSLAATFGGAALLRLGGRTALATGIVGSLAAGLWAIPRAQAEDDPGWVVIDEVAGQWIAMMPLGRATPLGMAGAFALFRALDITKPGVIGRVDRVPGRLGIMGDDVLAGAGAALLLWIGLRFAGRLC